MPCSHPCEPPPVTPGSPALGWTRFAELAEPAPLPVYALGGLAPADLSDACNFVSSEMLARGPGTHESSPPSGVCGPPISKVSYTCCVSGTFRGFRGRCFVMGPAPRRGRFSGICDWFSGVSESWWVRWVLGPALITGPPVAVLAYFDLDLGSTGLPKWLISTLSEHKLPAVIVAAVWIYAFTAVQAALQACAKANEGIDNKALLGLFETIERVVGSKARRFEGVLRTLRESPKAAAAVFSEITQPEQQIAVLAHGLHAFFGSIGPSVDCFKVTIAKIDEFGKPCAWMYYVPDSDPPRTPLETLRGVRPRHDVTLRSIL
jgi:hypothetical protein